jgi:7-carboxy-7-deazaguanine synthase
VVKIIDVKTPGSREGDTFRLENLSLAAPHDEYKFVITSRFDYEWSRDFLKQKLQNRANPILFSPSHEELPARELAAWILEDNLPVRLQLQAHKYIWGAHVRGV